MNRHTDMSQKFLTTRTGIPIGGAYVRPPPRPSADAEYLQVAMLDHKMRSNVLQFVWHPEAVERMEQRKTLDARRDYDSRGLTPLRRPSVIHLSWVGRLLAWIGRWC